jgi:alkanesulfonate monooxygenase SsuD/methylene tetrahydromethanopterin reductase-like flavin-dependent oxidoreductase (luciferase family)
MSTRSRFGIFVPQTYPWSEMVNWALLVESLGFDSFWIADHYASPVDPAMNWFECWTLLAALAARTSRIRLGTGVTHVVYRNPAVLAKAAMTVDQISQGRLELGMGVGSAADYNYAMTGVPPLSTGERVSRYAEAVALIVQLLRDETTTFNGDYFWVQEARMFPRPVQQPRPPFNLAAHYPRAMKVAATYGDAWNSFYPGDDLSPAESAQVTAERNRLLERLAQEAGRNPATIKRTYFVGYSADVPFAGGDALAAFIQRYEAAGINEFILGFVPGHEAYAGKWIVDEATLRQVAAQLLD